MILDHLARIPLAAAATTVNLDLEAVKPGPGEPLVCLATGIGGDLTILHAATDTTATEVLMVVDATEAVEFRLPSSTMQFVQATAAEITGEVNITLEGNQTNV